MSQELGCAQNPDGTLKDASEIQWSHSRNSSPIPLTGPGLEPTALTALPTLPVLPALPTPVLPSLPEVDAPPKKPLHGKIAKPKTFGKRSITATVHPVQKRVSYTNGDRLEILNFTEGPGKDLPQHKIAEHFHFKWPKLNQSTVHDIMAKRNELQKAAQEDSQFVFFSQPWTVKLPQLEEALTFWVNTAQGRINITSAVLKVKAEQFANQLGILDDLCLSLSNGWVESFKQRHGLREIRLHGEATSISPNDVAAAQKHLQTTLSGYKPCDIYNFDETGLYYRMPPDRTLTTQQISGGKGDKTQITLGLITNSDGSDIRAPLFLGHACKPRCFQKKEGVDLGFYYFWNKKAWMTGSVFKIFLEDLDRDMRTQEHKICLTIDNAPSHIFDPKALTNTEVIFLDPNMTSHIQPMDAGIIRAFKAHYWCLFILGALGRYKEGAEKIYFIDQLQGMRLVMEAWDLITPKTVANCWKHAGILSTGTSDSADRTINQDVRVKKAITELEEALKELSMEAGTKDVQKVEELLDVEGEKITAAKWTDDEIISQVRLNQMEVEGQHIPELEPPEPELEPLMSLPEACHALSQLNVLFQSRTGAEFSQAHKLLPKLRQELQKEINKGLNQADIRSYFS